MRRLVGLGLILATIVLAGCADVSPPVAPPPLAKASASSPLILVSIDGFRWDYLNRGVSPNLSALAASGVRAERMLPSFPSITFPNHYTLVTGLYPDHHGIVNNTFEDAHLPGVFHMTTKDEAWWDEGTPIWVSAERQGDRTATEFWPGSEVAIHGVRPEHWEPFNQAKSSDQRVDTLLGWLDAPAATRPQFLTLYFDIVDTAAHHHGPDSAEVNEAAATVDRAIGHLVAGLKARGMDANLIIVADHGMAATPENQHIYMDEWADPASFHIVTGDAVAGLVPADDATSAKLVGHHAHADCYLKANIPAPLHYGTNARIPPVVCIADVGWLLTTHAQEAKGREPLGEHGYDPSSPLMGALFIGSGPAFRQGVTLPPFPNVDVYSLEAKLIGVTPEPNDGSLAGVAAGLR